MTQDLTLTHAKFRTTTWSQIRELGHGDEASRSKALEALIARYWPPVYAHLRWRGRNRDAAAELTQAFFTDVVLSRRLFDRARPERGQLRSLILTSLQRFDIDMHRREVTRGSTLRVSEDALKHEEAKLPGAGVGEGTESPFERRWAMAMLEEALHRAEHHFRGAGRVGHWQLFEQRELHPAIHRTTPEEFSTLGPKHGFDAPAHAAAAVQAVKRRVSALLHEVVAETLDDGADVEAELAALKRYLM